VNKTNSINPPAEGQSGLEKRAVVESGWTPTCGAASSPGSKQAAGKPTVDELADDAVTRLGDAAANAFN
jgi:hypothetical protein